MRDPGTHAVRSGSARRSPRACGHGRRGALQGALEAVLPPGVVGRVATPGMYEARLAPEEREYIRDAVPARRREFTAGRSAARSALREMGLRDVPLPPDEDRVPAWPSGVCGTISHCDGLCVAAVVRRPDILGLGVDVEEAGPLEPYLVPRICTPREQEWIRIVFTPYSPTFLARVLFTVKEVVYKCCFPRIRRSLDFHDVEVTLDPRRGRFAAEISPAAALAHGNGTGKVFPDRLDGRFVVEAGFVVTGSAWSED